MALLYDHLKAGRLPIPEVSAKFLITNIADSLFRESLPVMLNSLGSLRPPFPTTWFEFSYIERSTGGKIQVGAVVEHENNKLTISWGGWNTKWVKLGVATAELELGDEGFLNVDAPAKMGAWDGNVKVGNDSDSLPVDSTVRQNLIYVLGPIFQALSFLNSGNHQLIDIVPPAALQKSRRKKGQIPLFSFSVIQLTSKVHLKGKRIRVEGTTGDIQKYPMPQHLRRGHFKRYGYEVGGRTTGLLFAKYKCVIYVGATEVGKGEHGFKQTEHYILEGK